MNIDEHTSHSRAPLFNLSGLPLPLSIRPAMPISDEELMRFSETNKPYKIERSKDGELTIMTPVGGIGGTHEVLIASELYIWARTDGRGLAFGSNTGFNLPDGSCLSPDAAWLSLPLWNALTPPQQIGFPPLCPEFVIEIRSQSDSRRMLELKMQLWLENGAQLAWLIDPIDSSAALYHPGAATITLNRPEILEGSGPVVGFNLPMARLWPS